MNKGKPSLYLIVVISYLPRSVIESGGGVGHIMPGLTLLSNDENLPVLKEPCAGVNDERLGDVLQLLKLAVGEPVDDFA